jgi:N-acetyl sugar amidotransferase
MEREGVNQPPRVCTRCIMDTTAPDIAFDDDGVCSYCADFMARKHQIVALDPVEREQRLNALVARIKAEGAGKPYDCIIGVSGGVDSSWVLVRAVELGLRPLAVHMDNGWNSELAQNNIANLVRSLGVDLHTHVIDWPEFRGLMEAFFSADVVDVELLYDNAMMAVNYRAAARYGVRYILSGSNTATEGMRMPPTWNWHKYDKRNIKEISRRFGGPRLRTFPAIGTLDLLRYGLINRIKWVSFLDLMEYRKAEALEVLTSRFNYKPYAYKHYESVFTRFYQGYILPRKFNVDKRKLHLSTLVMTGQMTRDEALAGAQGISYPSPREEEADRQYFLKKMGWSDQKLADYIARPAKPHDSYPSESGLFHSLLKLYKKLNLKVGRI